ncbi:MAG: type VI secretion system baseplate subunit TssG [Myxococcota bacterium]
MTAAPLAPPLEGDPAPLLAEFQDRASSFDFFRLVYLLERLWGDRPRLGHLGPAADERIRVRATTELAFASADIVDFAFVKYPDGEKRARIEAAFLGLYGATSPLPAHFAERLALEAYQGGPQAVRELLDVVHHRLFSLCYRAWSKYRLTVGYLNVGRDAFSRRMKCAVGLDGFGDQKTNLNPFYFLRFAPILASKSRSSRGLGVVLREVLGDIQVEIEQFVGHWTRIEKPLRNKLGVANHELGESLVIGRYVYDGSGRFTLKLGPLEYDDYLSFLPGGHRRPFLQSVIDTFTPGIHDTMLELHVDLDAAPRFQLGSPRASTIARTCWLGGSGAQSFSITVPLADQTPAGEGEHDDPDDRGEPPPLP